MRTDFSPVRIFWTAPHKACVVLSYVKDYFESDGVWSGVFCAAVRAVLSRLFRRCAALSAGLSRRHSIGLTQTRCGDRFMHHGTLLFGANMTDLSRALTVHPLKIQGKSIQSVRARVANISEFLAEPMEVTAFMDKLLAFVEAQYPDGEAYAFTEADRTAIARLCEEKYAQWTGAG